MKWRYQIIERENKKVSVFKKPSFNIGEVFIDDDGKIISWIDEEIAPHGETKEEVIQMLDDMLEDVKKHPVFVEKDWVKSK